MQSRCRAASPQAQAAEALPQPVVEARARQLGEHGGRARELDVDVLPRLQLDDRPAVDVDLDRLVARRGC